MSDRLQCSLQAIDAANARDPIHDAGEPAEFIYGRRMSEALAAFAPGASEPLRIAVRGQHIERWLSPRRTFPEGKAGYFGWRNAAKKRHAERLGQIMAACGYDDAVIARVGAWRVSAVAQRRRGADARRRRLPGFPALLRGEFRRQARPREGFRHPPQDATQNVAARPSGRSGFRLPRANSRTLQAGAAGARSRTGPLNGVSPVLRRAPKRRIGATRLGQGVNNSFGRASSGANSETTGAVGDVMGALLREIAAGLAAGEAGDDKDHG